MFRARRISETIQHKLLISLQMVTALPKTVVKIWVRTRTHGLLILIHFWALSLV